jgi:hypothetical protein
MHVSWWIKREVDQNPELESLSDWARAIRSLVQGRIHKLKNCVNSRPKSVFKDQEAVTPSGIIFNSIHNYLEIMFPIDVLRFSEFRTMGNHLSETLMLNDIQITSDYMSRWVPFYQMIIVMT